MFNVLTRDMQNKYYEMVIIFYSTHGNTHKEIQEDNSFASLHSMHETSIKNLKILQNHN